MTKKCRNEKWHVDGVPGVRHAFPEEIMEQQVLPVGLDLVRDCECSEGPTRRAAVDRLLASRFGRGFTTHPVFGTTDVFYTSELPARDKSRLAPVVGYRGYAASTLVAWRCSSGLYFVRRLVDGPERPLTIEHVIKVPEPKMLKVPGRRRPGYLTGTRP